MSENAHEMMEKAKHDETKFRLGHFLVTKTSFFDFTESKWSESAHIKKLGVIFHPGSF